MNWAGSQFDDVGMDLVNSLWRKGIATDLIPSSEIENESLRIDKDGYVCYGKQRYDAVILYHPEFEKKTTAGFFSQISIISTVIVGNQKVTFDAQGVAAVRLDTTGNVQAMVAGGLKRFRVGGFLINLKKKIDIALWKNTDGKWQGVLQGLNSEIPRQLRAITNNWMRLNIPASLASVQKK